MEQDGLLWLDAEIFSEAGDSDASLEALSFSEAKIDGFKRVRARMPNAFKVADVKMCRFIGITSLK